jgi:hypothetical protein
MLVTLPLLTFLLLFVFLLLRGPAESDLRPDWRDAFAEATILWASMVVAILLVLSPLHAVAQG